MEKNVVIVGAGGQGKVIMEIIRASGDRVIGFLDDNPAITEFCGLPVYGKTEDYLQIKDAVFVIGVGNNRIRQKLAMQMPKANWYTAIHPAAVISSMDVSVGEGSVIMAGAVVNPSAKIGRHCIVNTCAVVEHDNVIEDFCHISVGAKLAGTVTIGERTMVGIGACVSNNLSVCEDCMIGAGAVVVKDIAEPGTYLGVPARRV